MNEYDIQSLIYICISIDNNVRMLRGKQIAGIIHSGGYEMCEGCPSGMVETTYWAMNEAFPILKEIAEQTHTEMVGTPWLYEVCEEYGTAIIDYGKESGRWPTNEELIALAGKAIAAAQWH
ncbi:TPA: hypothetical protein ACNUWQ_003017 [Aeromonas salmonicida]